MRKSKQGVRRRNQSDQDKESFQSIFRNTPLGFTRGILEHINSAFDDAVARWKQTSPNAAIDVLNENFQSVAKLRDQRGWLEEIIKEKEMVQGVGSKGGSDDIAHRSDMRDLENQLLALGVSTDEIRDLGRSFGASSLNDSVKRARRCESAGSQGTRPNEMQDASDDSDGDR